MALAMSRWLTPGEGAEEGRGLTASMIASGRFRRHDRPLPSAALLRRKLPAEPSAVNRTVRLHKSATEMSRALLTGHALAAMLEY
jgi:hypothetical protein